MYKANKKLVIECASIQFISLCFENISKPKLRPANTPARISECNIPKIKDVISKDRGVEILVDLYEENNAIKYGCRKPLKANSSEIGTMTEAPTTRNNNHGIARLRGMVLSSPIKSAL